MHIDHGVSPTCLCGMDMGLHKQNKHNSREASPSKHYTFVSGMDMGLHEQNKNNSRETPPSKHYTFVRWAIRLKKKLWKSNFQGPKSQG